MATNLFQVGVDQVVVGATLERSAPRLRRRAPLAREHGRNHPGGRLAQLAKPRGSCLAPHQASIIDPHPARQAAPTIEAPNMVMRVTCRERAATSVGEL